MSKEYGFRNLAPQKHILPDKINPVKTHDYEYEELIDVLPIQQITITYLSYDNKEVTISKTLHKNERFQLNHFSDLIKKIYLDEPYPPHVSGQIEDIVEKTMNRAERKRFMY